MIVLRILDGEMAGRTFKLAESLTIGRGGGCDLRIRDGKSSRNHAVVYLKEGLVHVRDLGSKNGTLCDGEMVVEREIPFGTTLTIGDTNLVLEDTVDESELIGQRLGAYRVLELVGKGGMGVVFRANQLSLDRIVALKVLNRSLVSRKGFVDRFVKEAKATGNLNHPNLIQVHDFGKEGEDYWFSMEFVEGRTVSQILRSRGKMPERLALHVAKEVAKALDYAHRRGLVHRDIKPSNIMIDTEGHVKVADLGIAETMRDVQTESKRVSVMGTPEYMSPEQAKGKQVDPKSDIYSLGAALYHMVTGNAPFKGSKSKETVKMVVSEEPVSVRELLPEATGPFVKLLHHMMEKDRDKRIESAKDLISAIDDRWHSTPDQDHNRQKSLADFMKGKEKPKHASLATYAMPRSRQMLWTAVVAGIGMICLGGGIVLMMNRGKQDENAPVSIPSETGENAAEEEGQSEGRPVPEPKSMASEQERKQREYLAQARKAYQTAETYEEEHGDDLDGRWRRWRDYLSKYDRTPDAGKARSRMKIVEGEMNEHSLETFSVAATDAELLAGKGCYYSAINALKPFATGSHELKVKEEAGALIARYTKDYHSDFERARSAAERAMRDRRYASMTKAYQGFIDSCGGGPKAAEAKALLAAANKEMLLDLNTNLKEIVNHLNTFDFHSADLRAQGLIEKFEGTSVQHQVKAIRARIDTLKKLHTTAVTKIRSTESPKVLPFTIKNIGRGKATSASESRLSVDFGEIQQDLLWTNFTKAEVFEIYRMYLDETSGKDRAMLAAFAKQFRVKCRYYQPGQ